MLKIEIQTQPDDVTCGPTSLHSVYEYYADYISLEQTVNETKSVQTGGTIAPLLALHALKRGYHCLIYAYNIDIFDPTWFNHKKLNNQQLIEKLKLQLNYKRNSRIIESSEAYIHFLELGGIVSQKNLTVQLLKMIFKQKIPIITGLSATYLYQSMREYENPQKEKNGKVIDSTVYDDLIGMPAGHFVVLCGYDKTHRHVVVADPHKANPISGDNYYKVSISRLINSIMLGVLTYDANLLLISKKTS